MRVIWNSGTLESRRGNPESEKEDVELRNGRNKPGLWFFPEFLISTSSVPDSRVPEFQIQKDRV
jgi:hypothetical protein